MKKKVWINLVLRRRCPGDGCPVAVNYRLFSLFNLNIKRWKQDIFWFIFFVPAAQSTFECKNSHSFTHLMVLQIAEKYTVVWIRSVSHYQHVKAFLFVILKKTTTAVLALFLIQRWKGDKGQPCSKMEDKYCIDLFMESWANLNFINGTVRFLFWHIMTEHLMFIIKKYQVA